MSGCCTVLVALVSLAASLVPLIAQPAPEVIVDVRVHGNHTTPDEEVLKLAGLSVGAPATDQRIDDAAQACGRAADSRASTSASASPPSTILRKSW